MGNAGGQGRGVFQGGLTAVFSTAQFGELLRSSVSQTAVRTLFVVQLRYTTPIKLGFREVEYRWHPLHGQRVAVCGESRRGSLVLLRCVRDELQGCRTLEIPEWMFDAAVCGQMTSTELPLVECAALLALKHLLSTATRPSERDVVQAQHQSGSAGGADAEALAVPTPSERVTPFEAMHDIAPAEVTLLPGKGALGTWRSIRRTAAGH